MGHTKWILASIAAVVLLLCTACVPTNKPIAIYSVLFPHFENGELTGDFPGEAQYLYEEYFMDSEKLTTANGYDMFLNRDLGMLLCVTKEGKVNASSCVTAVLSDSRFDFSDAKIIACGCAGSAIENCTLCDVCITTGVCDFDLGHTADVRDVADPDSDRLWFYDAGVASSAYRQLNPELCEAAYQLVKDVPLETTELSRRVMADVFDNADWAVRDPIVLKGSSVTSDDYWKGEHGHRKALQITECYGCADPYAITEMEDTAIAVAVDKLGMLDQLLIVRVSVNVDVFLGDDTPEKLWVDWKGFSESIEATNAETLDCFEAAMKNMFRVVKTINDAALEGNL